MVCMCVKRDAKEAESRAGRGERCKPRKMLGVGCMRTRKSSWQTRSRRSAAWIRCSRTSEQANTLRLRGDSAWMAVVPCVPATLDTMAECN